MLWNERTQQWECPLALPVSNGSKSCCGGLHGVARISYRLQSACMPQCCSSSHLHDLTSLCHAVPHPAVPYPCSLVCTAMSCITRTSTSWILTGTPPQQTSWGAPEPSTN